MIGVVCQSNSCNILRLRIREVPAVGILRAYFFNYRKILNLS